tara:strand:+ start:7805 stop:8086 length:282 start_codon:yes stop_codon:yes gene_type:complete
MPFKRFGKCVYKTTKKGKKKEKEGCSDSIPMAKKYLKALYANVDDVNEEIDQYVKGLEDDEFSDEKEFLKKIKYSETGYDHEVPWETESEEEE